MTNAKPQRTHEEIDSAELFVNQQYWNISIVKYEDTGELGAVVFRQEIGTGKYIRCNMLPRAVERKAQEMLDADRLINGLVELTTELKARPAPMPRAISFSELPTKPAQSDMFATAGRVDDLPLFSGTAPTGKAQTFDPQPADRQAKLF